MNQSLKLISNALFSVFCFLLLTDCSLAITPENPRKTENTPLEKPSYSWWQTDTSLALLNHEYVVWQLNYERQGKPYFHPIALTDGTELTWLSPPDHPWHRGLWFSWKYINGLNYWEEDRKTGLSQGRTEVVTVKIAPASDYSAHIEMTLSYHLPNELAVLMEKRLITVSTPDEDGLYSIDWHSVFTASDKDVLLDRTPLQGEKGDNSYGGYAGLSVRIAKSLSAWQVRDSQGRQDMETTAKDNRWLDFSGETAASKPAGIAIFDHPNNLRHPTTWYVIMSSQVPFGYFSPAVLYKKPYTIPAGKNLTLRYRILIHPGRADKGLLENQWKAFSTLKDRTKSSGKTQ